MVTYPASCPPVSQHASARLVLLITIVSEEQGLNLSLNLTTRRLLLPTPVSAGLSAQLRRSRVPPSWPPASSQCSQPNKSLHATSRISAAMVATQLLHTNTSRRLGAWTQQRTILVSRVIKHEPLLRLIPFRHILQEGQDWQMHLGQERSRQSERFHLCD